MELDSLKYVWQDLAPTSVEEESQDILAMMQKRSQGPVSRMRRNLARECILIVVTYTPAILIYFIEFQGKLSGIAWGFISILLLFAVYFYRKDRLLRDMACTTCHVRSNLQQQVASLKRYIRFYTITGTLMIPAMAILTYLIIRWKFPPAPGAALFYRISGSPWWLHPLVWIAPLAIATVGMYYINAWYVGKLYGRHIRKLQDLLQEIDAD